VALLVDHEVRWERDGDQLRRVVEPVPEERLNVLRELVAGAVGLKPERGDQLIVQTLPFESTRNWQSEEQEPEPKPGGDWPVPQWLRPYLEDQRLLWIGAGAAVFLLIATVAAAFWSLRRRRRRAEVSVRRAVESGAEPAAIEGETSVSEVQKQLAEQLEMKKRLEEEAVKELKLPKVKTKKVEVLAKHLGEEAEKDPAAMARVMRTWLNEEDL